MGAKHLQKSLCSNRYALKQSASSLVQDTGALLVFIVIYLQGLYIG
jgi:hypothetical protein